VEILSEAQYRLLRHMAGGGAVSCSFFGAETYWRTEPRLKSFHANTLYALSKRELVQATSCGRWRGNDYEITDAGRAALQEAADAE